MQHSFQHNSKGTCGQRSSSVDVFLSRPFSFCYGLASCFGCRRVWLFCVSVRIEIFDINQHKVSSTPSMAKRLDGFYESHHFACINFPVFCSIVLFKIDNRNPESFNNTYNIVGLLFFCGVCPNYVMSSSRFTNDFFLSSYFVDGV